MFGLSDNKENLAERDCKNLREQGSSDLDEVNRGSHWKRDSKQSTPLRIRFKELVRQGNYEAMLSALQEIRSERNTRNELKELSKQGNYKEVQTSLENIRHEKKAVLTSKQETNQKPTGEAALSLNGRSKNNRSSGRRRPLELIADAGQSSFGKLFGRKVSAANENTPQKQNTGKVVVKPKGYASVTNRTTAPVPLGTFFGRRDGVRAAQEIQHDQEDTIATEDDDDDQARNSEFLSACSPFEWDNGSNVSFDAYYNGSHTFARTGNTELEAMLFQSK